MSGTLSCWPSLENFIALADHFGVSLDYLAGRSEDRAQDPQYGGAVAAASGHTGAHGDLLENVDVEPRAGQSGGLEEAGRRLGGNISIALGEVGEVGAYRCCRRSRPFLPAGWWCASPPAPSPRRSSSPRCGSKTEKIFRYGRGCAVRHRKADTSRDSRASTARAAGASSRQRLRGRAAPAVQPGV